MLISPALPHDLHRKDSDEPCLFPECDVWKLMISPDRVGSKEAGKNEMIPRCPFKGHVLKIVFSLLTAECATRFLLSMAISSHICLCVCLYRWPSVPSNAPSSAAVYEESQQWDARPPKEQCDSVGTWGDLHPVLLHALSSYGVGEPQCWAL